MSVVWVGVVNWCMNGFMDDWCMDGSYMAVDEWFTVNDSIETIVVISSVFDCAFMA